MRLARVARGKSLRSALQLCRRDEADRTPSLAIANKGNQALGSMPTPPPAEEPQFGSARIDARETTSTVHPRLDPSFPRTRLLLEREPIANSVPIKV
jgi:hypothetical protein